MRQRGVEDAPVVRVDGDRVAQRQPVGQVRMLVVGVVAQGDQVGGGADLDGDGLAFGMQLQHLRAVQYSNEGGEGKVR